MNNNKLIIAAAGSGKTTYLIKEALEVYISEKVLITTYTESNEAEIRKKILIKKKYIPTNITIQTWFSFLLQHGVRPYQGALNRRLFKQDVKGMILTNKQSAFRYFNKKINKPVYWGEDDFKKHYFTKNWKIYSDKLSKFVVKADKVTNGKVIKRISEIYSHIIIDEVQDLAGYDLEILKLLFQSDSSVLLVGDPRQTTYLTHHERKYSKYKDGKIEDFIKNELGKKLICEIDNTTLNVTHRNNKEICDFSYKLYPSFPPINPCSCPECRDYYVEHEGVFLIKENQVKDYINKFNPVILRWDRRVKTENSVTYNMGESKGKTFDRVLIYPTSDMIEWIKDNNKLLKNETRAKFYVATTRAKYSVAIIFNYDDKIDYDGLIKYQELKVVGKIEL
jgi:DNA helicase-2/ATP-dependent DNA helicase PcrA